MKAVSKIKIKIMFKRMLIFSKIFIFLSSASACHNIGDLNEKDRIQKSEFKAVEKIKFENIGKLTNSFIGRMHLIDSSLFLTDFESDFIFHQYNPKSKSITKSFFKKGTKFSEGIAPLSSGVLNKNLFWFHDVSLSRLVTAKRVSLNGRDTLEYKQYNIPNNFFSVQLKDSATILAIGGYHVKERIQEININSGQEVSKFGVYENKPEGMPYNSWKYANEGFLFINKGNQKAIIAKKIFDEFEILDLKTMSVKIIKGSENLQPKLKPINVQGKDFVEFDNTVKRAYICASLTFKYIYLLYSKGYELSPEGDLGSTIFVFDWQGNPIKKIIFENQVSSFTVSENDNMIYAFEPSSQLLLSSSLKN